MPVEPSAAFLAAVWASDGCSDDSEGGGAARKGGGADVGIPPNHPEEERHGR